MRIMHTLIARHLICNYRVETEIFVAIILSNLWFLIVQFIKMVKDEFISLLQFYIIARR